MTHELLVRRVGEHIAALAPRFPQLRAFDLATAVRDLSILYQYGVTEVPDPNYHRALAEYEAEVRAEPYRKRRPPPSPTMPAYRPDGVFLFLTFTTAEHAAMSAAVHMPTTRIGDLYFDLQLNGPQTDSFAELHRAIWQILIGFQTTSFS